MQLNPKTVSHSLVSEICSNICSHTSRNFPPEKFNPKMYFTCVVAIIIAAADVKPIDTGPEIKSIRNPATKVFL